VPPAELDEAAAVDDPRARHLAEPLELGVLVAHQQNRRARLARERGRPRRIALDPLGQVLSTEL
jgi:hypothetical protein